MNRCRYPAAVLNGHIIVWTLTKRPRFFREHDFGSGIFDAIVLKKESVGHARTVNVNYGGHTNVVAVQAIARKTVTEKIRSVAVGIILRVAISVAGVQR